MIDPALRQLVSAPAVPGYEDEVRARIRALVPEGRFQEDAIGNLTLRLGAGRPRVVVSAHTDHVGLLVVGVEADGAVRFRTLGGIDDATLPGRQVFVHTTDGPIAGVIGVSPPHLREGGETGATWRDLCVDVGARSASEAQGLGVRIALPITFHTDLFASNGHLFGRCIDDRYCCWILTRLAKRLIAKPPAAEVLIAWTSQNEVGMRGARVLAARETPDVALHLAAFGAWDGVPMEPPTGYVRVGGGPLIRARAGDAFASPRLVAWAHRVARDAEIPLQEGTTSGESEATMFQEGGAHGLSLNLAVRYLHTDIESISLRDGEQLERLVNLMIDRAAELPLREGASR